MKAEEYRGRIEELRMLMKEQNIAYYLVPTADFHNSEYVDDYFKAREFLCGFTGSNGTLVVSQKEAGLWTDGRYFIQAEKELAGTGVELFRMMEEGVPTIEEYLKDKLSAGQKAGFDGRVVDTAFGKKLEKLAEEKEAELTFEMDLAGKVWKERPSLPSHPVRVLSDELCGKSVADKLTAVRQKMKEQGCKYHLLAKLDDLMWLFNIRGADVECNPVALSYAFLTEKEAYFFIQKSEVTKELLALADANEIVIKEYEELPRFLKEFSYDGKVLLDEKNVSFLLYKIVTDKTEAVNTANPSELMKAVKNETELAHMRDVYLWDSLAVTRFIYWLKKNIGKMPITEISAAKYLDNLRAQIPGYLDLSFPTISAYKENAAMMHYEATKDNYKELSEDGMLLVDSGGQYLGGTTDVTRTIVLGHISDEIKKHYSATAAGMLQLTHAKFLYGCTGRNLDILARQPLWDMGIDYKCGTGHGVGYILNVHEGPQGIRWRFTEGVKEAVLEAGMVVTNEPGVYIEGSHGIRIENVLVAQNSIKNGDGQFMDFETLTFVPIDRLALDKAFLRTEDIARIDAYHAQVYEKLSPFLQEEEKAWLKEETSPL